MIKDYIETVKQCPIFEGISEKNLLHFLQCCRTDVKKFEDGEKVMSNVARSVICIPLCGKVKVLSSDGTKVVMTIDVLQPFSPISTSGIPYNLEAEGQLVLAVLDGARSLVPCDNCKFHAEIVQRLFDMVKRGTLFPEINRHDV